jgi:hypothetical protein
MSDIDLPIAESAYATLPEGINRATQQLIWCVH